MTSHRCGGHLASGAFPLPGGGQAPVPVCPGRQWSGCGEPAPAPRRPPGVLRGGIAPCGEGRLSFSGCATRSGAGSSWDPLPIGRGQLAGGVVGGRPRGVATRRCEGRRVSGAFRHLAARPCGGAARSCCSCVPGTGGLGDPIPASHRPHRVCPRGVALRRCEGRLRSGPRPSPGGPPSGRAVGVCCPRAVGAGVRAWGPGTVPLAFMPCGGLRAAGVEGGRSGGVAFRRCEGRLVSGNSSLGAGSQDHLSVRPGDGWCGHGGPSTGPTACALASQRCVLWGWLEGSPWGGALRRCEGRSRSGACPPAAARHRGGLSGPAAHVLWARLCGLEGPALSPWLACPAGGCVPRGMREAVPGVMALHRCEGRLVSGAVPPPAACPSRREWHSGPVARVSRAPVVWDPLRALVQAGVARCGGGGTAFPWGAPCAVVRGV